MKKNFLILAFATVVWILPTQSDAALTLGTADSFAVLAAAGVTNTGPTVLDGDLGTHPTASITGFLLVDGGPGIVIGSIHQADATAAAAQTDAQAAYTSLEGITATSSLTGQVLGTGGTVPLLTPGVYEFSSTAQLTGNLTLSGEGLYVFQIDTALNTASGSSITLTGGATSANVFWQVGSAATLGTFTNFLGTIIADTEAVTLGNGATLDGRAISLTAAVTLDNNAITVPTGVIIPEPTAPALLTLAGLLFLGRHRRTVIG